MTKKSFKEYLTIIAIAAIFLAVLTLSGNNTPLTSDVCARSPQACEEVAP